MTFLLVNIYRLSTTVISGALMDAFGTTGVQLRTLHAILFAVYALMQIPTGILVDRLDPRLTATIGAAVMNIGAVWFAVTGTYVGVLGRRFLIGLGGSVIFVSLLRFLVPGRRVRDDERAVLRRQRHRGYPRDDAVRRSGRCRGLEDDCAGARAVRSSCRRRDVCFRP